MQMSYVLVARMGLGLGIATAANLTKAKEEPVAEEPAETVEAAPVAEEAPAAHHLLSI